MLVRPRKKRYLQPIAATALQPPPHEDPTSNNGNITSRPPHSAPCISPRTGSHPCQSDPWNPAAKQTTSNDGQPIRNHGQILPGSSTTTNLRLKMHLIPAPLPRNTLPSRASLVPDPAAQTPARATTSALDLASSRGRPAPPLVILHTLQPQQPLIDTGVDPPRRKASSLPRPLPRLVSRSFPAVDSAVSSCRSR